MNRSVLTTLIVWSLIVAVLPASHAFSTIPFENQTNIPLNLADTLIDNSYDVANFSYKASDGMERSNISATSFNVTEPFIDQLVNLSSKLCLDTDGQAINGGAVRMWNCADHPYQIWTVKPVSLGYYQLINENSSFCLDTDGQAVNGGQVRMWECANHSNQLWQIQDLPADRYRLRNKASGFCLDTDGVVANNGEVRMWDCMDHQNQTWYMPKKSLAILEIKKLANLSSKYCLDTDGQAVNGGEVRMWECGIHPYQTWTMDQVDSTYYRLINDSTDLCLDTDGSAQNGGGVRMWECATHPNQLWQIQPLPLDRYQLKNKASGFCLDTDGQALDGGNVRMWACTDHPNQTWVQTFRPSEILEIPIVVIQVADDDGTHNSANTFSSATIKALIDDTNAILTPDAGIKLVLTEITTLRNTRINRLTDWSLGNNAIECPDAFQYKPHPDLPGQVLSESQLSAYIYASVNYPGQIVVYVRRQTYQYNNVSHKCELVNEYGGGFSHPDLNFIALSSSGATGELGVMFDGKIWQAQHGYLAHELGHYLGITHTMPNDWPDGQDQATTQLDAFCNENKNNPSVIAENLPDVVWDLDKLSDTAGDPGYDLYNKALWDIDPGKETKGANRCLGKGSFDVTSDVCRDIGQLSSNIFKVTPPRANLMSYTAQCPYLQGNTTGETRARITPQQVDTILHSLETNRKNLLQLQNLLVAGADVYNTEQNKTLVVGAPGVLENDMDRQGNPLSAELVSNVSTGNLTFKPDGSFTYVPSPGFIGEDSFRYKVTDGTEVSNIATVSLIVTPVSSTVGVFRPSNGVIFLKNTNTSGIADIALNYGLGGDYPVVGDWDGDGDDTIGVYRGNTFFLRNSNTVGFANLSFVFGQRGDQPIAGDWDGNGTDTIGVYRPTTGQFLLRNSNSAGPVDKSFYLGNVGDVAIAGDWNGDNIDTTGVFRPSNGVIFLKNTNETGFAEIALNYGLPGDKPVVGDWDSNGTTTIGIYRGNKFYLRNSNTNGFADITLDLGIPGDMPIAGNWDGLP